MITWMVLVAFGVLTKTSMESEVISEIVEKFIADSSQLVALVAIDDVVVESRVAALEKPFVVFRIESEALQDCQRVDSVANFTSSTPLNRFREFPTFNTFSEIKTALSYCDNVILVASHLLDTVLRCLTNPLETFLIHLTDNKTSFTDRNLIDALERTWKDNGASKVFLSIGDNVFSFDPFHSDHNGARGMLKKTPTSPQPSVTRKQLRNLNGYSMSIEMFGSTFTTSSMKSPKSVDDFSGPDARVGEFIRRQMNATSLF
jgi:hypothetical protein